MSTTQTRPLALIREAECIGCTKCIQACPVDAILGSTQKMHTVIADECIGCKLCLAPCPVDCIDLILPPSLFPEKTPEERKQRTTHIKKRYWARQKRLQNEGHDLNSLLPQDHDEYKTYVQNTLTRIKTKKTMKNID